MMKTESRLALSLRQRRFEWALARDEQARTAEVLVAGKTHDLLNLIQVIRLGARLLEEHCDPRARDLVIDLERSADDAQRELAELMAIARPADAAARGAPVGAAVETTVASLRDEIALDARVEAPPAAATRATAEELEHLVIALVLDAADAETPAPGRAPQSRPESRPECRPVTLEVRERERAGAPWIELVRASRAVPGGDRFELRVARAIAERAGGELSTAARPGGGEEVIVAMPEVA